MRKILILILILAAGCDQTSDKPIFYSFAADDLKGSGFELLETMIVRSKQMSIFTVGDIEKRHNYTVSIDEFETTEDAANQIAVELEARNQEFLLVGSEVFNSENEKFTIDVVGEKSGIAGSHCMTKRILDHRTGELEISDSSCILQKRRFIILVHTMQDEQINMTSLDKVISVFLKKIK